MGTVGGRGLGSFPSCPKNSADSLYRATGFGNDGIGLVSLKFILIELLHRHPVSLSHFSGFQSHFQSSI